MLRSNKNLVVGLALASLAAAACSSNGSAPTSFGVNVTVDATKLSAAELKSITSATLTVTSDKADDTPVVRMPSDLPKALMSGTAKFHYVPGSGITKDNKLIFQVDALADTKIVGSGKSPTVQLAVNAVETKIVLSPGGGNDGGPNTDGGGNDVPNNNDANPGDIVNPGGKANGAACTMDMECGTGFCTDGVCCNERCQVDVCASCNSPAMPSAKGTCTAFAADTDPEFECSPNPDAGTTSDAGSSEAGASEAGGSNDASATDADQGDGPVINTPDGGFMTMPKTCNATCGGMRACKFPDTTKSCGKPFCNTSGEVASFVCDGKGGCGTSLSECSHYKCTDTTGACGTSCNTTDDCLPTDFCDGSVNPPKCTPKKGNGLTCATPDQCSSNACSGPGGGKVCCNTSCDGQGQSCVEAGSVGKCQCQGVTCAAGVACQIFYRDSDGDTYGDAAGTIAASTAVAGCMGTTPPSGFVADNTDCDDGDLNVHPGQTAFFTVASSGKHTFDYNCDKTLTKQYPEYPGGNCKFCGSTDACSLTSATCSTANQASAFQCPLEYIGIIKFDESIASDGPLITPIGVPGEIAPRAAVGVVPIQPIPRPSCCGCNTNDRRGFLTTVGCGVSAYSTYTCNPCAAVGQGPATATATPTTQACH
jgi:hypothetical protein